jgi:hypothetical protein
VAFNVGGVGARIWDGHLRNLSLIPGRGIISSPKLPEWLWGPPSLLSMEIRGRNLEEAAGEWRGALTSVSYRG